MKTMIALLCALLCRNAVAQDTNRDGRVTMLVPIALSST